MKEPRLYNKSQMLCTMCSKHLNYCTCVEEPPFIPMTAEALKKVRKNHYELTKKSK